DRVAAATFSYIDDADHAAWLTRDCAVSELSSLSEDFKAARRVADVLGIPLIPVLRPAECVLSSLAPAILLCQDFRDFNVHCAIVNLFIAETIRARFADEDVIVLTGDLMNEYVCDYQEERIEDTVYYRQPRVPPAARRRFLLRGLDAGDREIGVFNAFDLKVCQPYAALARLYLQLPADLLADPDIKRRLNAPLLRPELRTRVAAPKRRAQIGGPRGGTVGLLHRHRIGSEVLRKLWADMLPLSLRGNDPWDVIQVGRYRTGPLCPAPRVGLVQD